MSMPKASIFTRFPQLSQIPPDRFPKHLLIIPDGNGRWAKMRHLHVTSGHRKGFEVASHLIEEMSELQDIAIVTMWCFSSDNWKRSEADVRGLMIIFRHAIEKILRLPNKRIVHIGRKDRIPKTLADFIQKAEEKTAKNTGQISC